MKTSRLLKLLFAIFAITMVSGISSAKAETVRPLIREGVVWEYIRYIGKSPRHYEIIRMAFSGTEIIDDKTYNVLRPIRRTQMEFYGPGESKYICMDETSPDVAIYMREDDNKIYRLVNTVDESGETPHYTEIVIFDYTTELGSEYSLAFAANIQYYNYGIKDYSHVYQIIDNSYVTGGPILKTNMRLFLTEDESINGESHKVWIVKSGDGMFDFVDSMNHCYIKFIEGIGPVPFSDWEGKIPYKEDPYEEPVPYPGTLAILEWLVDDVISYPSSCFMLNYLYSDDGEVLYTGFGLDWEKELSNGVGEIGADESDMSPRYFNLQGMPIAEPSAGQPVIRRIGNRIEKVIL